MDRYRPSIGLSVSTVTVQCNNVTVQSETTGNVNFKFIEHVHCKLRYIINIFKGMPHVVAIPQLISDMFLTKLERIRSEDLMRYINPRYLLTYVADTTTGFRQLVNFFIRG